MHRGLRAVARFPVAPSLRLPSRAATRSYSYDWAKSRIARPRLDYHAITRDAETKARNMLDRKVCVPDHLSIAPTDIIPLIVELHARSAELTTLFNTKRNAQLIAGDRVRDAKTEDARRVAKEEATALKAELKALQALLDETNDKLLDLALLVPNDTHPNSPVGAESNAVTLSTYGPDPIPADPTRDHMAVATALDLVDAEGAVEAAGSFFYILRNEAALLELALTNYALSIALKHGFTFVTTPDVVRADAALRCGFYSRDAATQTYHLVSKPSSPAHVLAGTAEIPLAAMLARQVVPEKELPRLFVGLGRAFRAEAGARGTQTHGLYRMHQFTKLELFAVTTPSQSDAMLDRLRDVQVEIFSGLGFPFRVLDMPTEELGASAYRKYDVEAWMPGRGSWGEISSASNCTDFQARRFHIRCLSKSKSEGSVFAHTLNGTAAAIPRLILALLENGARFDAEGKVAGVDLPKTLQPFWVNGSGRDIVRWV